MNKKQEILNEIEKMENKLVEFKQELNKTEEEWIPEETEIYWFYDKDSESIDWCNWNDDKIDDTRLKNKVIFKTEEEAQRYADYMKAKEKYSYEFSKEEWEDSNLEKYYIYYGYSKKEFFIGTDWSLRDINKIYFKTSDQAQEFINKYQAEILEFEFEIKE